jgi:hypothetical protein
MLMFTVVILFWLSISAVFSSPFCSWAPFLLNYWWFISMTSVLKITSVFIFFSNLQVPQKLWDSNFLWYVSLPSDRTDTFSCPCSWASKNFDRIELVRGWVYVGLGIDFIWFFAATIAVNLIFTSIWSIMSTCFLLSVRFFLTLRVFLARKSPLSWATFPYSIASASYRLWACLFYHSNDTY